MTISSLNKRLLIYAAITSPILAIYAIAPLYIFDKLNLSYSAILFSGLTIGILITWLINMFVRWKLKNLKEWQQFVVGFLLSSLSHIPKIWIKPVMPFENVIERYFTYPIITTFAIQVIIWVIINSVISNFKKKEMAEEVESLKMANLEAQKQMLLQQLQPHFLFNSLSVLKSLIKENADKAEIYAIQLSEFLRYSVQFHNTDLVTLEEELKFTNNYIEMQKVRFDESIQYSIGYTFNEHLKKKIPIFALQTLVENAIKHNAFTSTKPLQISIHFKEDNVVVCNNRIAKNNFHSTCTGLVNLKKRYELLSKNTVTIDETSENFCVSIKLL